MARNAQKLHWGSGGRRFESGHPDHFSLVYSGHVGDRLFLDPHDRSVDVHVRLSAMQYDTALARPAPRVDLPTGSIVRCDANTPPALRL
jgi:hypothetical protein